MRWILGIVVALSALWSGYWFAGSSAIEQGVDQWFADQAASGRLVAEKTALSVGGFPYRFDVRLAGVKITDPATGAGYDGPSLRVHAMTWKPWHVIAELPQSQVIRLAVDQITLTGDNLLASLRLSPSTDLPLAEARVAGQEVAAISAAGQRFGVAEMTLALRHEGPGPADYALGLNLAGLRPDPAFLAALAAVTLPDLPAADLPAEAGPVRADILLQLSAPLDRHAGDVRPHLLGLELRAVELDWGALSARATGRIAPDAQGYAAGEIVLEVTNWDRLPALLVAAGAVKPEIAPTMGNMMRALAAATPDPTVLKLPLKLADGWMTFGPFPLGPAPVLVPPSG